MIKMKGTKGILKDNKGVALISTLGLISTTATLSIALMAASLAEIRAAQRFEDRLVAFHWADGTVDQSIVNLRANSAFGGVASTQAVTARTSGSYESTVTPSQTEQNVYTISALGTVGSLPTDYGYQVRQITVVVERQAGTRANTALFANSQLTMSGNAQTDAYDSRVAPYNPATATNEGHIATNASAPGMVSLSGNVKIKGDLVVGPGANPLTAARLSGNAAILGDRVVATARNPMTPVQGRLAYKGMSTGDSVVRLEPGTYVVSSLNVGGNGALNCTGPTDIYVAGDVHIAGNGIVASHDRAADVKIHIQGERNVTISGNGNVYGLIYAPESHVKISGNAQIFGSVVGESIHHSGNGKVHLDKALLQASGQSADCRFRSWSES